MMIGLQLGVSKGNFFDKSSDMALLFAINTPLQTAFIKNTFRRAIYIHSLVNNQLRKIGDTDVADPRYQEFCMEFLFGIKEQGSLELDDNDLNTLAKSWSQKIFRNEKLIRHFENVIPENSNLFLGSPGKTLTKILSFACQNKGGKTTSFSHGNEIGLHSEVQFNRVIGELQCYNQFVFSSENIARRYENACKNSKYPLFFDTRIISSSEIGGGGKSIGKFQRRKIKGLNRIKNIMLIGYPMSPFRIWSHDDSFFYTALKTELMLCSMLRKMGFYVTYKAHPDRLGYIEKVMESFVDDISVSRFEKVTNKTDAFLFHYSHTSTFGSALMTDKPITLVSNELAVMRPADISNLKTRISIVDKSSQTFECELLKSFEEPIMDFSQSTITKLFGS